MTYDFKAAVFRMHNRRLEIIRQINNQKTEILKDVSEAKQKPKIILQVKNQEKSE